MPAQAIGREPAVSDSRGAPSRPIERSQLAFPDADGTVECDVAIIGSGMGGSSFAWALRNSGLSVVVVERGTFLPREIENWSTEEVFGRGRYANTETWFDGKGKAFSPGIFYYVGGNTKVYGAMLPRFRETDFKEVQHAEGTSLAWPISYGVLEPFYAQAEVLYKVHGQAGCDPTDPPRSTAYPFPALRHDPALVPLARYMSARGLHPFAMPAALDYSTQGSCILCSTCDGYPCLLDAKGDAEQCALRPALQGGYVRLLDETIVERLETNDDGGKVLRATGTRHGNTVRISAKNFVIACGAVNTAALLLKSATREHPRGLGNSSDQLGRNYMVHNSTFMLAVDPRRKNEVVFQKTLASNDWYLKNADQPYPLGNIQMLGKIRAPMITKMKPWIPKTLARYLTDHSVDLYLTSEDLPAAANRVTVGEEGRSIKVAWRPNNLAAHVDLVKVARRLMRGAGYPLILSQRMGVATNSHQCGTAVMGLDASRSVVDETCRMHDIANVWIVDSSSFPSSAAVNPALTIAANALRVAKRFLDSATGASTRQERSVAAELR